MEKWKRLKIWLKRIKHRKGYGVQSPFAFGFVVGVIYEKTPYYAYPALDKARKSLRKGQKVLPRKVDRLLFRLANFHQPDVIINFCESHADATCYLQEGCKHAQLIQIEEDDEQALRKALLNRETDKRILLLLGHLTDNSAALNGVMNLLQKGDMVVVEQLYHQNKPQSVWEEIKGNNNFTVTFDLYDVGIALMKENFFKQHYVINF